MKFTVLATLALASAASAALPAVGKDASISKRSTTAIHVSRDYLITYDSAHWASVGKKSKTSATAAFCKSFTTSCKNYAYDIQGTKSTSVECVTSQAGPKIYAYCAVDKVDRTVESFNDGDVGDLHAKIAQKAVGKAACLKAKKANKKENIVC